MRYAVVIEKGERNYSAYVPDLPGCVSVGDTLEEAKAEIREAIAQLFDLEECSVLSEMFDHAVAASRDSALLTVRAQSQR